MEKSEIERLELLAPCSGTLQLNSNKDLANSLGGPPAYEQLQLYRYSSGGYYAGTYGTAGGTAYHQLTSGGAAGIEFCTSGAQPNAAQLMHQQHAPLCAFAAAPPPTVALLQQHQQQLAAQHVQQQQQPTTR